MQVCLLHTSSQANLKIQGFGYYKPRISVTYLLHNFILFLLIRWTKLKIVKMREKSRWMILVTFLGNLHESTILNQREILVQETKFFCFFVLYLLRSTSINSVTGSKEFSFGQSCNVKHTVVHCKKGSSTIILSWFDISNIYVSKESIQH